MTRTAFIDGVTASVTAPDGRQLAYLEVGDPQGPLVMHNHGGPSSRLEARLFADAAARNGLRLICVDRPGMGQSSAQKARTYSGWADDLVTVADALGCSDVRGDGLVGGRPVGAGRGGLHRSRPPSPRQQHRPGQLRRIRGQLGGAVPFEDRCARRIVGAAVQARLPADVRRTRVVRQAIPGQLRQTDPQHRQRYDRQLLLDPAIAKGFGDACAECFAHGSDGLVRDAELLYRRWAFDVKAIERPVHLWQGLDDTLVPDPINKAVADAMPGAVWHPVDGAGHFVAIGAGEEIFAIAAKELGAS